MLKKDTRYPRSQRAAEVKRGAVRGMSIVELMIGVAIGLVVVAGGAKLLADGLIGNRRTTVEARISQDLRAAADIMTRDLRRAGYWQQPWNGVSAAPAPNLYRNITTTTTLGAEAVTYSYDKDGNLTLDAAENLGFQIGSVGGVGVLQMQVGLNNWQALTDPRSVDVTAFRITPVTGEIRLGGICERSAAGRQCCRPHPSDPTLCKPDFFQRVGTVYSPTLGVAAGTRDIAPTCPELVVRRFDLEIEGRGLPPDITIQRKIQSSVRVRNDEVTGTMADCPP
jgi:prepilin peptidase dependent protein B